MTKKPSFPQPTGIDAGQLDLQRGLMELYTSSAHLMLNQYTIIESLLGNTNDWTAPGTHCETLLRDLLRQVLPSCYAADKGFIYGRRIFGDDSKHCPEIDVLVHDEHNFRPVYRVEDFVIVQAKATHAAIQVKRRMNKKQLRDGLRNVMDAKDHFRWLCYDSPRHPGQSFFSAVIFFDEESPRKDGRASAIYKTVIKEYFHDPKHWFLAPDVFGSLKTYIFRRDHAASGLKYTGFPAIVNGHNIAVLILLTMLENALGESGCEPPYPRFKVPASLVEEIIITPLSTDKRHEINDCSSVPHAEAEGNS